MKRIIAGLLALSLVVFGGQAANADRFEDILKKGVVRSAVPLDVPSLHQKWLGIPMAQMPSL